MTERSFIQGFQLRNYRCVRECELQLTRLHALIGPNDSGKSTLLEGLRAAQARFHGGTRSGLEFKLEWSSGLAVERDEPTGTETWTQHGEQVGRFAIADKEIHPVAGTFELRGEPRGLRLNPDALRKPSKLIRSTQSIQFQSDRGDGLASVYDALLSRNRRAFDSIEQKLKELFSSVEALVLTSETESDKQIAVQLRGQPDPIAAPHLSEGLLYYLAFAALPHLTPTPLITIEEPENGLHPTRIADVVRVLRAVSTTVQVVVATHSPLLINELAGNEVSVITRDLDGTHAVTLDETLGFAQRSTVYKNGEIWLSFGDGTSEAGLIRGK